MEKVKDKTAEVQPSGLVDLLLNILENTKSGKEDKLLARNELKRMIASVA